MIDLLRTRAFDKAVGKLDSTQREQVKIALKLLRHVPPAPSLHFKWLKPTRYWSARVDANFRIILVKDEESGNCFHLIDVCNHSVYDRRYATH